MTDSIFFQCKVLDNQDPLMLGRIRGVLLIDNYDDIIKSITDPPWNEEVDSWTSRDPFIFNTLLPYFVYAIPKVNELVQVIYVNKDFKYQNQYYIQNTFSTPTATYQEFYFGGNKFTGTGMQIKNPRPLKNKDGTYTDKGIQKGVFPEPGDNAVLGRGSADLIVKQDEVLLRAGKFKGSALAPNETPIANQQRGFLQLSRFPNVRTKLPDKKVLQINEKILPVNFPVMAGVRWARLIANRLPSCVKVAATWPVCRSDHRKFYTRKKFKQKQAGDQRPPAVPVRGRPGRAG